MLRGFAHIMRDVEAEKWASMIAVLSAYTAEVSGTEEGEENFPLRCTGRDRNRLRENR